MQGFNMGRYIPPDVEGNASGNSLHKRRAPGTLRKDGTQTVRFEMPFAVWCHTCNPHAIIGQGVRFNATKQKVGYYHSTPIWSFRLKHTACGGFIEIRTDPKNTAYVVTEGGKGRDYGDADDKVREGEGGLPILTPEERERRREDAFAQLEGKVEEKEVVQESKKRITELYGARERDWSDTWSVNKRVRDSFRRERKLQQREEKATEALKERLGTDMELLPATEEDAKRAELVDFMQDGADNDTDAAASKPLFKPPAQPAKSRRSTQRDDASTQKDILRKRLIGNTRAAMSPF